jgi:putative membrane protein
VFHLFRAPLLHAGGADPTGWLWSDWNVEPTIAVGLLVVAAGYLWLTRRKAEGGRRKGDANIAPVGDFHPPSAVRLPPRQRAAFLAGLATLFIALGPPLDDWSDHYLLTAHMVQHLLLTLLAAPLLLVGIPGWMLEPLTRNRVTNAIGYWLTRPVIAYAVANAVFVLWHVPLLYEAALRTQPIHVLEHVTLLGGAILAWWPIAGPLPQWPRLPLPLHSLYFFAMTLPGGLVGAFITFAEPGLYAPYDTAPRIFGIDLQTDQHLAGLLMWVAVSAIYLLLITVSFFRWASREEAAERAQEPVPVTTGERSAGAPG